MTAFFHPLSSLMRMAAIVGLLAAAGFASADAGHNHDAEPTAAAGTASPRLYAHSDLFELVGIVDKGQMTIYLDRYATNEPVVGAKIEFEAGANRGVAQPQADGTYLIQFEALSKPGELPFSLTVSAGTDNDLLTGDLDLKGESDHHDHEAGRPWLRWFGYVLVLLAALAVATLMARRYAASRQARLNG